MNKLTIIVLLFISSAMFGQDSIKKWKVNFQLDNRYSSIRGNDIVIFGAKLGLQYKKLTRFGIGSSFILNPVNISYIGKKTGNLIDNRVSFWYGSLFNDWILYKRNNWECFVTEQIGYGEPSFVREVNNEIVSNVNVGLFINEISGQANYKILPWIGAGAGLGYRNLLNGNSNLKDTFNAPVYIVKVIIYPGAFFD